MNLCCLCCLLMNLCCLCCLLMNLCCLVNPFYACDHPFSNKPYASCEDLCLLLERQFRRCSVHTCIPKFLVHTYNPMFLVHTYISKYLVHTYIPKSPGLK